MGYIGPILVIVAALVALSGLIISKKPELKATFDKIAPYQGFLGVGLLAWGVWDLIHNVIQSPWPMPAGGSKSTFGYLFSGADLSSVGGPAAYGADKIAAVALLGYIISEILLGFMLGFGLIASWIPGESGAEKGAVKVQKKLLALAVPIGFIGLACGVLWLIKGGGGFKVG